MSETLTVNTTGYDVSMATDYHTGIVIITLEPHYEPPVGEPIVNGNLDVEAERTPDPIKRKYKTRKKVRKVCRNCERTYNGDAIQKYCSRACKQAFYKKYDAAKEVADTTVVDKANR